MSFSKMLGIESYADLETARTAIVARRYGVIEARNGALHSITLRPWPKFVSLFESLWWGSYTHTRRTGDICRLYYNQPMGHEPFLALKYMLSGQGTRAKTCFAALDALDQIARLKRTDAIVCEAANFRLSDRMLGRHGWERHTKSRTRRNYIKRFYGEYPAGQIALATHTCEEQGYELAS